MVPVVPNSSLRINLSLARFRGALCLYGFQGPRKVDSDAIVDKWSGLLEPGKTTLSPREGRLVERVAAPDQPQTVWPKDRLSPQTLAPQLDQRHEHLQLDVHEKLDELDHEMMQLEKHYVGATEVMTIRMSPPPPDPQGHYDALNAIIRNPRRPFTDAALSARDTVWPLFASTEQWGALALTVYGVRCAGRRGGGRL